MFDLNEFLISEDMRTIAEEIAEPATTDDGRGQQLALLDACQYGGPRNRGRNVTNVPAIDPFGNIAV